MGVVELEVGDVIKIEGILLEITKIIPHQDIPGAVYYKFHTGEEVRDVRLHPESIYKKTL